MHTIDALTGAYIRDLEARNTRLATIKTYEESFATFRAFLQDTGGSQDLNNLTSDLVRAYQVWLREAPMPRFYKGTTKRSIGGAHIKVRQLRALVRFGEAEGIITQSGEGEVAATAGSTFQGLLRARSANHHR